MIKNDRSQIRQVFTHLIHYTVSAVPKTGGKISLSSEKTEKGIRIKVTDNGPEIPPEKMMRIFDPEFSSDTSGAEMGLSVCRQVLENLGGTIGVENRQGQGLIFFVALPENFEPRPHESGSRT